MIHPDDEQYPVIDYRARRAEKARVRTLATRSNKAVRIGVAVAAVILVSVVAEASFTVGRVHPGVSVSGVRIGGMTPRNAQSALQTGLEARSDREIVLVNGEKRWKVTGKSVGVSFDYALHVRQAMDVGREGNPLVALGSRLKGWTSGVELPATATLDDAKTQVQLDKVAKTTDVSASNATVEIENGAPRVIDGKDGRQMDREAVKASMAAAFGARTASDVQVPIVTAHREIDAAKAQVAADAAKKMLASSVTITYKKSSWDFSTSDFADWIQFEATSAPTAVGTTQPVLAAFIAPKAAEKPLLRRLGDKVGSVAENATFKTSNGHVTIIPSQTGMTPDLEALASSMTHQLQSNTGDRVLELRMTRSDPKVSTEKAQSMGIKERISTFTTTYDGSNRPRTNNIHLLAEALDGTLLEPGSTFSFNGIAGERTAAKGYQEAPAIVKGKLVPQLGGGVCQVGTTVFNAVFKSGLPVTERHNHSFYISHYPKGRDATVSWGGPDLKFKNDTKHWVLVSVSFTNSSLTVSLYGTDPNYEVTSSESDWRNVKEFPTEEVKDDTLAKGAKIVEDRGISGRSITVTRTVKKDGEVVRTDKFVSVYRPKIEVVRVGTKPTGSKPAAQTPKQ